MSTVELPGFSLSSEPGHNGLHLIDLRNYHDGPAVNRKSEPRERGFGLFPDDDPQIDGAYPVVIGKLTSLVPGSELELREKVMALENLESFTLAVTDDSGTWHTTVAISGTIGYRIKGSGWAHFEIPLEAADPRKYGPKQTIVVAPPAPGVGMSDPFTDPFDEGAEGSAGRAVCVNLGSAPTEPIVRIYGGMEEGFELTFMEQARVVRVTRPIPPGSWVTVNHSTGEVWIDEQSLLSSEYVPVGEWFQIGPGETGTIQWEPKGAVSGAHQMVVEFASAKW